MLLVSNISKNVGKKHIKLKVVLNKNKNRLKYPMDEVLNILQHKQNQNN